MHARLFHKGKISVGSSTRQEHHPGADIVFISAHDTELRLLAEAHLNLPKGAPSLSLTNYLALSEQMAIDSYVDETLAKAKLVVLRQIGGEGYWADGVEALRVWAHAKPDRKLALAPGGTTWDERYASRGTLSLDLTKTIWRYLSEGGNRNCLHGLQFMGSLIGRMDVPPSAESMPLAGFVTEEDAVAADAIIIIYRSLAQASDLEPVDVLKAAMQSKGLRLSALYVSSLKDPVARAVVATALMLTKPSVIINATAFSADTAALFKTTPVLQTAFIGQSRRDWVASQRGMTPSDLAMNVVMAELDGRVFTVPIAFKTQIAWDAEANHMPTFLQSDPAQISALVSRVAALIALQRETPSMQRVATILANYPNRDGRLANGVGLDTPRSCTDLVVAMHGHGYAVADAPRTSAVIVDHLTPPLTPGELHGDLALLETLVDEYALAADLAPRWARKLADDIVGNSSSQPDGAE